MADVTSIKVITRPYLVDQFRNYNNSIVQPGLKHLEDTKADKTEIDKVRDDITNINEMLDNINSSLSGKDGIKDLIDEAIEGIVAGAPEAFDTLKEIADWIGSDTGGVQAMTNKITANSTEIENLKNKLAKIMPENVDIDFESIIKHMLNNGA